MSLYGFVLLHLFSVYLLYNHTVFCKLSLASDENKVSLKCVISNVANNVENESLRKHVYVWGI